MDKRGLLERIQGVSKGRVLLVTHRSADVDALASVAMLKFALEKLGRGLEVEVYFPGKISKKASSIQNLLGFSSIEKPEHPPLYPLIIFLDVGGSGALDEGSHLIYSGAEKWLVDHHLSNKEFQSHFDYVLIETEDVSSTCEIIYRACREVGLNIPRKLKIALLASILTESGFLRIAKCETFSIMAEVCKDGIEVAEVLPLLKKEKGISERIAVFKALKRMEAYRSGDWMLALSKVGSYHSEATRVLRNLETDFTAVGDDMDSGCKVHIRLSARFIETFGLTAGGDLVKILSEKFGGQGGGHNSIAVVELDSDLEDVFRHLKDYLDDKISGFTGKKLLKLE